MIGLTDNPDSPLFKEADHPILIGASPPEKLRETEYNDKFAKQYTGYHHDIAQTKTFFANILCITAIVFELIEKPHKLKNSLENDLVHFESWLQECYNWVVDNPIINPDKTIFVGSGLFYSLAKFGQYKWFEFTFPGLSQDIEEYAHTHYFVTDEASTVIFFAPSHNHRNRIEELIFGALQHLIKPQIFVITSDKLNSEISEPNILHLPKFHGDEVWQEVLAYIYSLIYIEWVTYCTAVDAGLDTNKFRGGKEGEKYVQGSFHTIRRSNIES